MDLQPLFNNLKSSWQYHFEKTFKLKIDFLDVDLNFIFNLKNNQAIKKI